MRQTDAPNLHFIFCDISKGFIKSTCHQNENIALCLCLAPDLLAYPPSIHLFLSHLFSLFVSLIYLPLCALFFSSLRSVFYLCFFPSCSLSLFGLSVWWNRGGKRTLIDKDNKRDTTLGEERKKGRGSRREREREKWDKFKRRDLNARCDMWRELCPDLIHI